MFTKVLVLKLPSKQLMCRLADQDRVGRRQRLEARGEIGRLAYDLGLARFTRSGAVPDDDEARSDSCANFEGLTIRPPCVSDALDDRQGGANRLSGIVFVGQRVAEIRQHAVAHELGKEAVEPGYRAGADVLISPDQRAHILGVDRVGQFCRADQVAKHDGDLTSLRVARRGSAGRGFWRRRRAGGSRPPRSCGS